MVHIRVHLGPYLATAYAAVQPLPSVVRIDRRPLHSTMPSSMTPRRGGHSCCTDESRCTRRIAVSLGRGGKGQCRQRPALRRRDHGHRLTWGWSSSTPVRCCCLARGSRGNWERAGLSPSAAVAARSRCWLTWGRSEERCPHTTSALVPWVRLTRTRNSSREREEGVRRKYGRMRECEIDELILRG